MLVLVENAAEALRVREHLPADAQLVDLLSSTFADVMAAEARLKQYKRDNGLNVRLPAETPPSLGRAPKPCPSRR